MKSEFRCEEGDLIDHRGTTMEVAMVMISGTNPTKRLTGKKAYISAHKIMGNGQVLRRSALCIDQDWSHISQ